MTSAMTSLKSLLSFQSRLPSNGSSAGEKRKKKVALSEIKDDLSRYLRLAEKEEVMITRHGKPAGVLIGFGSADDRFDYRIENDPRFLCRVEAARRSLGDGKGVRSRTWTSAVVLVGSLLRRRQARQLVEPVQYQPEARWCVEFVPAHDELLTVATVLREFDGSTRVVFRGDRRGRCGIR